MACIMDQNPLNRAFMQVMKEQSVECYYSDTPSEYRTTFRDINNMIAMIIAESESKKHTHKLNFGGIDVHTKWEPVTNRREVFFTFECFWVEK